MGIKKVVQAWNSVSLVKRIVIGLVIGYIAAWFMGIIDFSSIQSYGASTCRCLSATDWTSTCPPSSPWDLFS